MGVRPSDSGESWLGVEVTVSEPSFFTESHAQPLPKRDLAAVSNCVLNASKPPKDLSMAADTSEPGLPPSFLSTVQNSEWLAWPPPWLRMTVRMSSGTALRL